MKAIKFCYNIKYADRPDTFLYKWISHKTSGQKTLANKTLTGPRLDHWFGKLSGRLLNLKTLVTIYRYWEHHPSHFWFQQSQQSQNMAKFLSPTFWHHSPGACDLSEVWATLRWTYNFQVWLLYRINIALHLLAARNYRQKERQKIYLPHAPADLTGWGHK